MKVLITGANGYIGSNLVKYLAGSDEYEIFALVREKSNLNSISSVKGNLNIVKITPTIDSINSAILKTKPDVVVHLAALSLAEHGLDDVEPLILSNFMFPAMLIESMIRNNIYRLVNTGSFWEYTKGKRVCVPVNLYAAIKVAFEEILKFHTDANGLCYVTLKLFGTYGTNDPRPKVFSFFKKSIGSIEPVLLSPGEQMLDLAYIDDVVAAYEKAIHYVYRKNKSKPETFFIGSGKSLKLRQIAQIYQECIGRPLNVKWGGRPYRRREIMRSEADIIQAKRKLKWEPKFDLKSGIRKMLSLEKQVDSQV